MKQITVLVILFGFLFNSCTKTIEIVPEYENAKYGGVIHCIDEFGKRIENAGVSIMVNGIENISTTSDEKGFFQLSIPIGIQTFIYSKDGYGNHVDDRRNFIGGTQPVIVFDANLYKPVNVSLKDYAIDYSAEENSITVSGWANCKTPYSLQMSYRYDMNSDNIYFTEVSWEDVNLGVDNYFSGGLGFLEYNLHGNDTVYVAISSNNYYDQGYAIRINDILNHNYGTNIPLTEFKKIVLEK